MDVAIKRLLVPLLQGIVFRTVRLRGGSQGERESPLGWVPRERMGDDMGTNGNICIDSL